MVADRTETRWGKFRPYLLWLAVPFGLMAVLTFCTPPFGETGKVVYAFVTYSLMMMVYSAINVPYASLLGVMSPHPQDRNVLSTFRMMFAYIGSFVALLLFMPLVNAFTEGDTQQEVQQHGWLMAVGVIAVACTLLFLGCFKLTKERVKPVKQAKTPLKTDIRDLLSNRPWWILLGAGIASLVFNSIRDGATVYYFKYFVDETAFGDVTIAGIPFVLSGLYLAVGQASNIIGVVLAAPVASKIGKRQTFMWAMIIATVLSVVFYFVGRDQLGLIFSSSSMSQKFGWAIGTAVTGWLLAAFGFQANAVQNAETIQGIKMFLSLLPAVGTALSVAFIFFYPLTEQKMQEITNQLESLRKKK